VPAETVPVKPTVIALMVSTRVELLPELLTEVARMVAVQSVFRVAAEGSV
jgi:hypothetical protein